jgi:oligoribonuclease (3'-5' exoribonuclease)
VQLASAHLLVGKTALRQQALLESEDQELKPLSTDVSLIAGARFMLLYHYGHLLGKGMGSAVVAATNRLTNQPVAIKMEATRNEMAVHMLLEEIRASSQQHATALQNVITMYDFAHTRLDLEAWEAGQTIMSSNGVERDVTVLERALDTLENYLKRNRVPVRILKSLLSQVFCQLHLLGILFDRKFYHRDLHHQNVLVAPAAPQEDRPTLYYALSDTLHLAVPAPMRLLVADFDNVVLRYQVATGDMPVHLGPTVDLQGARPVLTDMIVFMQNAQLQQHGGDDDEFVDEIERFISALNRLQMATGRAIVPTLRLLPTMIEQFPLLFAEFVVPPTDPRFSAAGQAVAPLSGAYVRAKTIEHGICQ